MSSKNSTPTKLRTWIHGIQGKMGQNLVAIQATAASKGFLLVGGSSNGSIQLLKESSSDLNAGPSTGDLSAHLKSADLVIDFSTPLGTLSLLKSLQTSGASEKSVIIATTGFSDSQKKELGKVILNLSSDFRILVAPNTSIGILLMRQQVRKMREFLADKDFDVELIETHHKHKVDAPSGTAKSLVEAVDPKGDMEVVEGYSNLRKPNQIGVHSVRGGGVYGEHTLRFISPHEEISITHRALSRTLFASGALNLGRWLSEQKNGAYTLDDIQDI